jgi:hypothetical protein
VLFQQLLVTRTLPISRWLAASEQISELALAVIAQGAAARRRDE